MAQAGTSQDARANSIRADSSCISASGGDAASQAQQIWAAAWQHFDWPSADTPVSTAVQSEVSKASSAIRDQAPRLELTTVAVTMAESSPGAAIATGAMQGVNSSEAITRAQFALQVNERNGDLDDPAADGCPKQ